MEFPDSSRIHFCLLVNPKTSDIPVRVLEISRILVDVINTSLGARRRIDVAGPVSAERKVDNQVLVSEVGLEVAIIVNKVRVWGSPVGGVDGASSVLNLVGNSIVVPRPEPKVDGVGSAFSCVPSASVGVKRWPVIVGLVDGDTAAGVSVDLPVAIGSGEATGLYHVSRVHGATVGGVKSGVVGALVVYPFDDVDFTQGRPVGRCR